MTPHRRRWRPTTKTSPADQVAVTRSHDQRGACEGHCARDSRAPATTAPPLQWKTTRCRRRRQQTTTTTTTTTVTPPAGWLAATLPFHRPGGGGGSCHRGHTHRVGPLTHPLPRRPQAATPPQARPRHHQENAPPTAPAAGLPLPGRYCRGAATRRPLAAAHLSMTPLPMTTLGGWRPPATVAAAAAAVVPASPATVAGGKHRQGQLRSGTGTATVVAPRCGRRSRRRHCSRRRRRRRRRQRRRV